MQTNIITYLCFFILCGLVVCDMWLSTNILLQIVCIVLALLVVVLTAYIAYKHHKGTYTTAEQQSNYQGLVSDNVALTKELNHIKSKQAKSQINSTEVQQLITFNARLTFQISNLKTHLQTVYEQLQTAKNSKQTAVVPITPNEQPQTSNHVKKSKTA
jgi:regulator of replication initiation timing